VREVLELHHAGTCLRNNLTRAVSCAELHVPWLELAPLPSVFYDDRAAVLILCCCVLHHRLLTSDIRKLQNHFNQLVAAVLTAEDQAALAKQQNLLLIEHLEKAPAAAAVSTRTHATGMCAAMGASNPQNRCKLQQQQKQNISLCLQVRLVTK